VPRVAAMLIAILCVYIASYRVWKRKRDEGERMKSTIEELRGRPQVSLAAIIRTGEQLDGFHFRFMNASDDTATNIILSPIVVGNVAVDFIPIPALTKTAQGAYTTYAVRVGNSLISDQSSNKDLLLVWRKITQNQQDTYGTTLRFSNFDGSRTWEVDYSLICNYQDKSIRPVPGHCRMISSGAALKEI
jgi:hypothetical protein